MKKSDAIPGHLTADARRMWQRLRADYCIDDAGGLSLLRAACESFQRSEEARAAIAKSGAVQPDRFGINKLNPWVTVERDSRSAMVAAIRALKLAPGEGR